MSVRDLEGPPAPYQMRAVFSRLVIDGKYSRAEQLANTMSDWWMAQPIHPFADHARSAEFYQWLGCASAIGTVRWREEQRR